MSKYVQTGTFFSKITVILFTLGLILFWVGQILFGYFPLWALIIQSILIPFFIFFTFKKTIIAIEGSTLIVEDDLSLTRKFNQYEIKDLVIVEEITIDPPRIIFENSSEQFRIKSENFKNINEYERFKKEFKNIRQIEPFVITRSQLQKNYLYIVIFQIFIVSMLWLINHKESAVVIGITSTIVSVYYFIKDCLWKKKDPG